MSKEANYFSHDYHSRSDDKIQALLIDHGPGVYGIFWAIIEILHENENHKIELTDIFYKSFAKQMSTSVEQVITFVRDFVQVDLLKMENGNKIYSERVNINIEIRDEISEGRSKAGKASAAKRALLKEISTNVEQPLTSVQQIPTKESKVKETKGNEKKESKENILALRKKDFATTLEPFVGKYGKEMMNEFYKNWSEANRSQTKLKFELQDTWEVGLRLATWKKKSDDFKLKSNKGLIKPKGSGANLQENQNFEI